MNAPAIYLTDDRDLPDDELRTLVIFQGGNGDWYVQIAPKHGRTTEGVRLCTSGGASSAAPGLTVAVAEAYRAIKAAEQSTEPPRTRTALEDEVAAWRAHFPHFQYARGFVERADT